MAKFLSDVGELLAVILDAEGGRIKLDRLNVEDGVGVFYDLSRLAEASMIVAHATRGFDTGAHNQSVTDIQTIGSLPPLFQLWDILVSTDDATRLTAVQVWARLGDAAGTTTQRDHLLWRWDTGDATAVNTRLIGDASLATQLLPSYNRADQGIPYTSATSAPRRRGVLEDGIGIRTETAAFGAGTVRVTGHLVLSLFQSTLPRGIFALPV